MPIYRTRCDHCGAEDDLFRPIARMDELPSCCGETVRRVICAPMVIADIQPYQAMAVDVATGNPPVINSRSEHREFLRRNGYVEVGNEMPKQRAEVQGDFNVRRELTDSAHQILPKYTV